MAGVRKKHYIVGLEVGHYEGHRGLGMTCGVVATDPDQAVGYAIRQVRADGWVYVRLAGVRHYPEFDGQEGEDYWFVDATEGGDAK